MVSRWFYTYSGREMCIRYRAWKEKLTEMMVEKNGAIVSAILLSEKKEMDAEDVYKRQV